MRSIRAGKGLGDALYLQSVVRHLAAGGERFRVLTQYPDVFRPLNGSVELAPFARVATDINAHYTLGKSIKGTTQFEDSCRRAGIKEPVEMRLDWKPTSDETIRQLRYQAAGRPIVLVQMMRQPMLLKWGGPLLPSGKAMQAAVDRLRGRALLAQVGAGECLHKLDGIDVDLVNRQTVAEMFDVASAADAFLGWCSFFIPLAESLGKRALFVWSARGLRDHNTYIRTITPMKLLHRKDLCTAVMDNEPVGKIQEAADALLQP